MDAYWYSEKKWEKIWNPLNECHPRCVYQNYNRLIINNGSQKTQHESSCVLVQPLGQDLTLILLMWRIWWAPNNASKWQMELNLAFKKLIQVGKCELCKFYYLKDYSLSLHKEVRVFSLRGIHYWASATCVHKSQAVSVFNIRVKTEMGTKWKQNFTPNFVSQSELR